LGYKPDEIEDDLNSFFSAIHPDDIQNIQTTLDDHLAGRTPLKLSEVRLKTKSGEYRWFADRGKVVAWTDAGKPSRMVGTITDITAQKMAESNLQDSERRYRALVEWSPEPAAVHRGGRLVYVNPAFLKLVQVNSVEEALKHSLLDYVHPDDRPLAIERMQAVAAGAPMAPLVEMRGIRPNGTDMYVETQGTAIMFDGAPAVHVVVRDISQRKQAEMARAELEAQLRESQKMQAIGTLAGGIAHDFNNILAIILGNVELASQDAGSPRELESLGEIRKAATRARDLVRQILSFSRRQPAERKRIQLQPVVIEAARLLKATLPARLALDVRLSPFLPEVMADATQIEQVVLNLCTNAMQAIPLGNGNIRIEVDVVALDEPLAAWQAAARWTTEQRQQMVRLVVSDDGPGMTEEVLSRIFEPFFTTKPVDEGTGLGLSVVHGIVEGHDGAIVCESAPGEGASFTVYLPPAIGAEDSDSGPHGPLTSGTDSKSAKPPQTPTEAGRGLRVLYLDDDDSLVFLIERLLARRGFKIEGFTDQQAAIKAIAAEPSAWDVLVTDYNMPGMTGLEVARAARALRPNLPVGIASGFLDERLREEASAAGVSHLIFKATAVDDFCEAFVDAVNVLAQEGAR
jgi:PAS domain S-box-containing protein